MTRVSALLVFSLSFVIIVLVVHSTMVASQPVGSQMQLSKVIQDVQAAELSGANPDEMRNLSVQLNRVIGLQEELETLPSQELGKRAQLSEQINDTLTSVDMQANQIATRASERTSIGHFVAYSSALVGAVIATVVYHYGTLLRRRYRIKRTLQMTVIPKKTE
jgi:hypothetical protein